MKINRGQLLFLRCSANETKLSNNNKKVNWVVADKLWLNENHNPLLACRVPQKEIGKKSWGWSQTSLICWWGAGRRAWCCGGGSKVSDRLWAAQPSTCCLAPRGRGDHNPQLCPSSLLITLRASNTNFCARSATLCTTARQGQQGEKIQKPRIRQLKNATIWKVF